jgi:hypothetical protein
MCECIDKVNGLLKDKGINATVSATLPLVSGIDSQVLVLLDKKGVGKMPTLAASFCPFCGEMYKTG